MGASLHAATLPNARWHFPETMQIVAGRGGYQTILNRAVLQLCKFGYFPLIEGSCTGLTTVYTVLKRAQMATDVLERHYAVISFYIGNFIYAK